MVLNSLPVRIRVRLSVRPRVRQPVRLVVPARLPVIPAVRVCFSVVRLPVRLNAVPIIVLPGLAAVRLEKCLKVRVN